MLHISIRSYSSATANKVSVAQKSLRRLNYLEEKRFQPWKLKQIFAFFHILDDLL